MSEIAIAASAVALGNAQVQHHQLIALARMLERALVGCLDAHLVASAVHAGGPLMRPRPHMNILSAFDGLDQQSRNS